MAQSPVIPLAGFPLLIPLANFLLPLNPSYLLGIPPLVWCDPVHPGPRLLVNWPPPPHSLPIPISRPPRGFPKSIVRLTKTTSWSRLHIVRNSTVYSNESTSPVSASTRSDSTWFCVKHSVTASQLEPLSCSFWVEQYRHAILDFLNKGPTKP